MNRPGESILPLRESEHPVVRRAQALLYDQVKKGDLDEGEMCDLSEILGNNGAHSAVNIVNSYVQLKAQLARHLQRGTIDEQEMNDLIGLMKRHLPLNAPKVVETFLTLKSYASNGTIDASLGEKLLSDFQKHPLVVSLELSYLDEILSQGVPDELRDKIKVLYPSRSRRLLQAVQYVRSTVEQLLGHEVMAFEQSAALEGRDPLLAELQLRMSASLDDEVTLDPSVPREAKMIARNVAKFVDTPAWPISAIPNAKEKEK